MSNKETKETSDFVCPESHIILGSKTCIFAKKTELKGRGEVQNALFYHFLHSETLTWIFQMTKK